MPQRASDLVALQQIVDRTKLALKAQPELLSSEAMESIMGDLDEAQMSIDSETELS
jgi:hypothetical protein